MLYVYIYATGRGGWKFLVTERLYLLACNPLWATPRIPYVFSLLCNICGLIVSNALLRSQNVANVN